MLFSVCYFAAAMTNIFAEYFLIELKEWQMDYVTIKL
jgi:hypothetical protein